MQQALYSCFRGPDMKLRTLRHVRVRIRKARRAPPRVPGWWVGSSCGVAQEARDASSSSKATTASTSKASQPSPETSDASGQSDRARKRRQRNSGRTSSTDSQKDEADNESPQHKQQWHHVCPDRQRTTFVCTILRPLFRRIGGLKIFKVHTNCWRVGVYANGVPLYCLLVLWAFVRRPPADGVSVRCSAGGVAAML